MYANAKVFLYRNYFSRIENIFPKHEEWLLAKSFDKNGNKFDSFFPFE